MQSTTLPLRYALKPGLQKQSFDPLLHGVIEAKSLIQLSPTADEHAAVKIAIFISKVWTIYIEKDNSEL